MAVTLLQHASANGWQENQRFLTDVLHEVMLLDGLSSSHPISQEVEQASDIDRVFDWIAYKKVCQLVAFAWQSVLFFSLRNKLRLLTVKLTSAICALFILVIFYLFAKICQCFQL